MAAKLGSTGSYSGIAGSTIVDDVAVGSTIIGGIELGSTTADDVLAGYTIALCASSLGYLEDRVAAEDNASEQPATVANPPGGAYQAELDRTIVVL